MKNITLTAPAVAALLLWSSGSSSAFAAPPGHEHGYANGQTVTISVKDPHPGQAAAQAQHEYFEVIYPVGWESLGLSPLCVECDHLGDGDDWYDYHDHVFSGAPSQPGKEGYAPLWQLNLVTPAYNGDLEHDALVTEVYATFLPAKSSDEVAALLDATLDDGSPVAALEVTDYVFLAAIVNAKAAH